MPRIDIGEAQVSYLETGAGEPVVLLHCTASSGAQWQSLMAMLGDRFRVVAPDLLGHGESDPWSGEGPISLAAEAEVVAELIARRPGPVHLVGHSYGGAVALRVALDQPGRVKSLTLIEPVAFHLLGQGDDADDDLLFEVEALAGAIADAVVGGHYAAGLARFVDYWNGAGTWARTRPQLRQALCRQVGTIALDFRAVLSEPTEIDAYRRLTAPTLLLRGSRSPATTRRIVDLLAGVLPRARVEEIADAGHMAPITHRAAVDECIVAHLEHSGTPLAVAA